MKVKPKNDWKTGDPCVYEGDELTVLGFAASRDINGNRLVEIAWNDLDLSLTGYLAVPEYDLYYPCLEIPICT